MLFVWLFASIPLGVSAAAAITEIMYDAPGTDSGREWVEVQNTGSESVDLSTWRFVEGGVNHKISVIGESLLPAGGFAVIADNPDKFKIDNPGFSGLLFDSAFSLSNEGETISIDDDTGVSMDSVSYDPMIGAAGDGNTLQKTGTGEWIAAAVSVGSVTIATESAAPPAEEGGSTDDQSGDSMGSDSGSSSSSGDSDTSAHSSQEVANTSYDAPQFEVTAGRPRIGFVGAPLSFEAKVKKSKDVAVGSGLRSVWTMGDGSLLIGQIVSHAYQYPGDYIVITNTDYGGFHAVAKVKVRIIEPSIALSLLPGRMLLSNQGKGEVNIGGFILEDSEKRFAFPQDTIILPLSSIEIPLDMVNIDSPKDFIRIANPSGKVIAQTSVQPYAGDLTLEEVRSRLIRALEK
ncbi:MAG TPA: lamin tail domain-containing protein [Thermodesulfobacteriota bacterium]|nr:lamin tail domain-containing protein [Thermodesulfobacteriota bacterium]